MYNVRVLFAHEGSFLVKLYASDIEPPPEQDPSVRLAKKSLEAL